MKKKDGYDNEKVIFSYCSANLSFTNPSRSFLLFYLGELKDLEKVHKCLNILDIGCGAGAIAKALKEYFPNHKFAGCDISRNAIKIAKKNPGGVNFSVEDATKLSFKDEQFNVVIANSVIDHTKSPKKVIKEANRVLKKKGILLLTDPLEDEPTTIHGQLTRSNRFRSFRKERCGHCCVFSKKTLIELIENNGFKVQSIDLDWFFLRQLIDVVYYSLLALSGRGAEYTIDSYLRRNKPSFARLALGAAKKTVTFLENIESLITYRIPLGWFAYIRAIKK